ncbi:MAG: histidine ammonia-lyase [Bacteroidia bacterium]
MYLISTTETLTLQAIARITETNLPVGLTDNAKEKIIDGYTYLQQKIKNNTAPIYGINTGFGSLCNTIIPNNELSQLQENLVKSHACGTGDAVPLEIVKLMLLLKIQGLSYGNSGVQLVTVERLLYMYNNNILPVIYTQGSLGASGDLAPLAHLSLPLLGLGKVHYKGNIRTTKEVYELLKLTPIQLGAKEGLALLNGTQFMSAYGVHCVLSALRLSEKIDSIACMSIDAFDAKLEPYNLLLHTIRPHSGQINTSKIILKNLRGSQIAKQAKQQVQDPYSFRCIPQVHGATKDTINYVAQIITTEINSVTDNPTIFPDEDLILSGGNFHGQPLALALDFLAIAMAELGSISERRTYLLISGQRNLPPYLVTKAGVNSGFMIPQYTAASIVSQNKQYCTPASIDSIVSSNGQEDHVSMGANAATKCLKVIENIKTIAAIEYLTAAQGLEFRMPLKSSVHVQELHTQLRTKVAFVTDDIIMHDAIQAARELV